MPYNQNQRPQGQAPSANYTLPGVISYLTSEFTNLERYKIMTDLEKSEMKYKIAMLQGEVEAFQHTNNKLERRIHNLEQENSLLRLHNNLPPSPPPVPESGELPEVDVKAIERSRHTLSQSIHEITDLLRRPTNLGSDLLQKAHPQHETDLEALFDAPGEKRVDARVVSDSLSEPNPPAHNSVVGRYFNGLSDTDDFLNATGSREIPDPIIESDAETEIYCEDDFGEQMSPILSTEPLKFSNDTISLSHEGKHLTITKGEKVYKHSISLPLATEDIVDVHLVTCEDNQAHILVVHGEGRVMQVCVKKGNQTEIALVESSKRIRNSCLVQCSPALLYLVLEHHDVKSNSMEEIVVNNVSVHDSLLIVQSQTTFSLEQIQGSLADVRDPHLLSAEYHELKAGSGHKNSNAKNRHRDAVPLKIKFSARRKGSDVFIIFEAAKIHSHIVKQ